METTTTTNGSGPSSRSRAVDRAILAAAVVGDLDAAARLLLHHHGPRLARFLRTLVAGPEIDDLVQETYLAALEALRRGRYRREGDLYGYLRGVARHKALRLRHSFWHLLFQRRSVGPQVLESVGVDPPMRVEGGAAPADLGKLLSGLSERERLVVRLRMERRPHREIGTLLGISEDNAAQIHHRAVARLRRRADKGPFLTPPEGAISQPSVLLEDPPGGSGPPVSSNPGPGIPINGNNRRTGGAWGAVGPGGQGRKRRL